MVNGIVSERSFGRKKFHLFPGAARIDKVDEVDSNFRERLDIAASLSATPRLDGEMGRPAFLHWVMDEGVGEIATSAQRVCQPASLSLACPYWCSNSCVKHL